jgi:hypothetical protein
VQRRPTRTKPAQTGIGECDYAPWNPDDRSKYRTRFQDSKEGRELAALLATMTDKEKNEYFKLRIFETD